MKRLSDLGIEKIRTAPKWMLEESLLRASLSANPRIVESELSIHRAEWFIDPGHNVKLSAQSKPTDAAFVSSIPLKISFQFVFLRYEKNKKSKLLETYKKLPWRNGDVLRVAKKKNNTRTCAHTRHYLTSYYELDIGKMIPCIIIAV